MIALEDRQALVQDIGAAQSAGARLSKACEVCGIDRRTLHRWKADVQALQSGDLDQARDWAREFVHWYNVEHLHSGIRYVSPNQRHAG
jgi:transposase InsO family protein